MNDVEMFLYQYDDHRNPRKYIPGTVWVRHHLDELSLQQRIEYTLALLRPYDGLHSAVYVVYFWETIEKVTALLGDLDAWGDVEFVTDYVPQDEDDDTWIVKITSERFDVATLQSLLTLEFHYEHALEPSLNMRVLLYLHDHQQSKHLFRFYDDRGFDEYRWLKDQ